jgi:hypothetical protein
MFDNYVVKMAQSDKKNAGHAPVWCAAHVLLSRANIAKWQKTLIHTDQISRTDLPTVLTPLTIQAADVDRHENRCAPSNGDRSRGKFGHIIRATVGIQNNAAPTITALGYRCGSKIVCRQRASALHIPWCDNESGSFDHQS